MLKKLLCVLVVVTASFVTGCASVPMAPTKEDAIKKEFTLPSEDMAGLYIYRNSSLGSTLKKTISLDGEIIGETAPMTYFYLDITPGYHILATESEFSDNILRLNLKGGENYFIRHYIKMGLFVGGANFEIVHEREGKAGVEECKLAKQPNN